MGTRLVVAVALLGAVGVLLGAVGASGARSGARAGAGAAAGPPCKAWNVRTIASGLGVLENLEPDGTGGMLISNNGGGEIQRLLPDGSVRTLIANVPSPGGQRIRGRYLYFNAGDSAESGVLGSTEGTIQRYDLKTGARATFASGLAMPNGLIFLPDGDLAVSRDVPGWGITRVPFAHPTKPQRSWVATNDSNGLAIDPTHTWLYWDQTFQPGNDIMRAKISNPGDVQTVASLGQGLLLDDLTSDSFGVLYIASNKPAPNGALIRFNPTTKQQCVIATGLGDPSAVKFGCGKGWSANHLYAVGFEGDVYDISAPAGIAPPRGTCDAIPPAQTKPKAKARPRPKRCPRGYHHPRGKKRCVKNSR